MTDRRAQPGMDTTSTQVPEKTPPQVVVIRPAGFKADLSLSELWAYRDLLSILVWRGVSIQYKQTVIGIAWAIVQPVMTMIVFTIIFGKFANIQSDGLPYPLFSYVALLPWNLFSRSLTQGSMSLVSYQSMLTKVYFPRIIAPLSLIAIGIVDFLIAFVLLIAMMIYYGTPVGWPLLTMPFFLLMLLGISLGISLWLAGINVEYRDVKFALPFLAQLWMYVTPVVYPMSLVPDAWRPIFLANPMAAVIEGFRWSLVGGPAPSAASVAAASMLTVLLLVGGLISFNRAARTFADRV